MRMDVIAVETNIIFSFLYIESEKLQQINISKWFMSKIRYNKVLEFRKWLKIDTIIERINNKIVMILNLVLIHFISNFRHIIRISSEKLNTFIIKKLRKLFKMI